MLFSVLHVIFSSLLFQQFRHNILLFCFNSLGIIFFEMCYRPLTTLMERDKIIGNIRRPEIILPNDFICEQNSKQVLE